jgi:type VI secretion system secreted protein VgrG
MAYTQENRLIAIDTPLGKDALLLTGFHGIEGISGLFGFELDLLSENHNITFEDIIGKNVTVSIILADGDKRFFNGIISSFSQGRGGGEAGGDPHFSHYSATMVPWLWLLKRTADSRIFQKLSVPDIVEKIFTEKEFLDYKLLLNDSYEKRDYCVQYRETDFNFISRLLEEEGICYFFEHEEKKHTLILADASDKFKPCPKQESARYQISAGGWLEEDVITILDKMQEIRPAKYTINDFNFEIPGTDMKVDVSTKQMLGPGEREIYDYPGLYTKKAQGERLTTIRMEEEETKITSITGSSDCRAFTSGYKFNLSDYYREDMDNKDYVLTHIEHEVREVSDYYGASIESMGSESPYINRFKCIPYDVPYRPSRDTVKPVVRGTQTAIVVGPAGEEIYTDGTGRVKVQFHWDREGKKDENSSCWIRVSQTAAGQGWGSVNIPRIGHEVVVDFLEGDPDRPIINGCVYNGMNTIPFGSGIMSGAKSNTSPGGGGYNEFSLNDTAGKEMIIVHGQYDMESTIENDQTLTVHNNRTSTIDVDDSETVGSNQTIKVGANQDVTVGANQSVKVGSNKTETISIAKALSIGAAYQVSVGAAMNESVGAIKAEEIGGAKIVGVGAHSSENVAASKSVNAGGNISEKAGKNISVNAGGNISESAGKNFSCKAGKDVSVSSGKNMSLSAGDDFAVAGKKKGVIDIKDELVIKCGKATITLKKNGDISINGKKIQIKGSGDVVIKGKKILQN